MIRVKPLLVYYCILSLVFFSGRLYIMNTYHMTEGPVPQEAFQKLFNWVSLFAYFYIVPLLLAGLLWLIRFFRRKGLSWFLSILLSVMYILFAAVIGYVLLFVFVLMFYGFAP
ncbi:hypothetical protein [Brevibacillus panacihumi]|nr:hypothetical protein [Brevibacillus panacihumi]